VGVPARPLADLVHPTWVPALEPVADTITELGEFLRGEVAAGRGYLPAGDRVLRAFSLPLPDVRVLVVGQDPYPTPGDAHGLAFSYVGRRRLPPSLKTILAEMACAVTVSQPLP
jgi:uracil-DNA glycosylase